MHDRSSTDTDYGTAIIPVPAGTEIKVPKHSLGKPQTGWEYKNEQGQLLFIVARFLDKNGEKTNRPLTYREFRDGSRRWAWKGLDAPRPLFQLDYLSQQLDKTVIVTEGEKAAEAAMKIFPDHVATTSPNGAGSSHLANWKPLKGRNVIIWPDHDEEGRLYAEKVAEHCLKVGAASVSIVTIPDSYPGKWDLGDNPPEGCGSSELHNLLVGAERILTPYEKALTGAESLTRDYKPNELTSLLEDVKKLSLFEQRKVKEEIRKNTGVPYKDIDAVLKELKDKKSEDDKPTQLDMAWDIIDDIGKKNLLSTTSHTWKWLEDGYWRPMAFLELKQLVQNYLDGFGCRVTKGLVDAVSSLLQNAVFDKTVVWDQGQNVINVKNGELHLEGGKWHLKPHNRDNYRTTQIPHNYEPDAFCPRFDQFLDEIFRGDSDAIIKKRIIWEMIGYSLTNTAKYEKFILLVGRGANGKSVLLEIIMALVGYENTAAVQPAEFSNKFQRGYLHRKLVNIVTELKKGAKIPDAELKATSSGELITAEEKNKPPFTFKPYCTCWFGTNHMPHTDDFSDATFRRAIVIEFNNKFMEGAGADPNLKNKLRQELPGIMKKSLDAYASAVERGFFSEPPSSKSLKERWRTEEDCVAQFVQECCQIDESAKVPSKILYNAFKSWSAEQGRHKQVSKNEFSARLKYQKCILVKGTGGQRMVQGLKLNTGWH